MFWVGSFDMITLLLWWNVMTLRNRQKNVRRMALCTSRSCSNRGALWENWHNSSSSRTFKMAFQFTNYKDRVKQLVALIPQLRTIVAANPEMAQDWGKFVARIKVVATYLYFNLSISLKVNKNSLQDPTNELETRKVYFLLFCLSLNSKSRKTTRNSSSPRRGDRNVLFQT